MLSNELITFCNRWLEKADKYTNDTTEEVFDKFFSLYVVYNAIYTEATSELKEKNSKVSTRDRQSATENIPVYIGQDKLFNALQIMKPDIDKIVELIGNSTFHISINRKDFTADTEEDNKNLSAIKNNTVTTSKTGQKKHNEAVLSLIYGTRCNMFHGSKSFEPIQEPLLIPMNNILEMIIKELLLQNNEEEQ